MVRTFAAVALLCWMSGEVLAQSEPDRAPEGWAYELAEYLMSPFCPGRTISDCPSQQAKNMKMWMIVQEAAGRSREEVEQELIATYGEDLRPTPRAEGFGMAAYLFPLAAFVAGGAFIGLYLRRQTRTIAVASPASARIALDPELEKLLDEELSQ